MPISFKTEVIDWVTDDQFTAADAASPTAPAAINAIPIGNATPVKASIAPTPNSAPLTSAVIVEIVFFKSPVRESQFNTAAEARDTAPIAIIPIPNGMLPPENASIAPRARNAPPTIDSIVPIALRMGSDSESQFNATAVARETAPATIRAIPKGTETPVNANNAPNASNPPPTILVRFASAFFMLPSKNFQLIVAAVANETAPAAINATPRGTFTPPNASTAPMANRKPPSALVIVVSVFANCSDIVFQFSVITETKPTAPIAIKPRPTGMFAPVTTSIVPIANAKPLTTAVISSRASLIMLLILPT